MRRCEDEAENGSSVRYPSLLIGDEHTSAISGSDCIVLSRSQLLQRLAARGAETDRLDHQLIALRSGLGGHEWGHKSSSVRVSDRAASQMSDQDAMDAYSGIEAQLEDPALSSTATIGGVLSLTRTLLSLTPLLQHLSLAAYLVSAACGPRAPAELRRLRSLSLGPLLSLWSWHIPLRSDIAAFASVERLQLSGHKLSLEQAVTIVGRAGANKGAFPNLREFQWTFPNPIIFDESSASS